MMILLISITILFLYIPNSYSWAGTSPSSSCSSFSTVNILHGSGPAATLGLSLKFFTLLQARGLSLQNYRDLVVVTLFGPGSGMILERVPGKNLQEKRFQTSLKSHSLPGRRTWNVVDGGKTEKKKQRNYPRGQTRIGVVQKRGEPTRGEKSTSFFSSFFLYHFPTTTTLCNRFLRTFRIHDVPPVKNRHTRTDQPTGGHDATALFFPENDDDDGFYGTRRRTGFRIRSRTKEK